MSADCYFDYFLRVGLELSHVGGIYHKGMVCSQGAEKEVEFTMKTACCRFSSLRFDRRVEKRDIRWFYITKF